MNFEAKKVDKRKVSVITIAYNNYKGLKCTLDSILEQEFKEYELIVIDGDSKDGSKELLQSYIKTFKEKKVVYKYISEKDSGIYNAMNKGVDIASGEWVIFMNSGDIFADKDVMLNVFDEFVLDDCDVIYGDFYFKNSKGKLIERRSNSLEKMEKALITCHQAIFTRLDLLKKRNFMENYQIIADYEWYLNAYIKKCRFHYIPIFMCIFDGSGISSTNDYDVFCECLSIRKKHGTLNNPEAIVKLKKIIMYLRAKIKSVINC